MIATLLYKAVAKFQLLEHAYSEERVIHGPRWLSLISFFLHCVLKRQYFLKFQVDNNSLKPIAPNILSARTPFG